MRAIFFIILFTSLLLNACSKPAETAAGTTPETTPVKRIPVEVMIVSERPFAQNIAVTGVLEPVHAVDLIAETSAKMKTIYKKLGQNITPRDTLAVLDDKVQSSQYQQALAQVRSAENSLAIARLNYSSDEQLYRSGDISKLALETSELNRKSAEAGLLSARAGLSLAEDAYFDTRITSPISGYISRDLTEVGMAVSPGQTLYRVVDLSAFKIKVNIAQDLIGYVNVGNPVKVFISALGNRELQGEVRHISPEADNNSGGFEAELRITNPGDSRLRGGLTCRTEIQLSGNGSALIAPEYAVVSRETEQFLYKLEKSNALLRPVKISRIVGSEAIIESGLNAGDTIIVIGMKNLGQNTPVSVEAVHQ